MITASLQISQTSRARLPVFSADPQSHFSHYGCLLSCFKKATTPRQTRVGRSFYFVDNLRTPEYLLRAKSSRSRATGLCMYCITLQDSVSTLKIFFLGLFIRNQPAIHFSNNLMEGYLIIIIFPIFLLLVSCDHINSFSKARDGSNKLQVLK